jgi:hypothetical protein
MNTAASIRDMDKTEIDSILSNAEKFRQAIRESVGIELDYGLEGIRWTDGFINRGRERWSQETSNTYLFAIGSYLGETLRRALKGKWVYHQEFGPGIAHRKGVDFPFNKIQKQIHGGHGDSILGMFTGALFLDKNL